MDNPPAAPRKKRWPKFIPIIVIIILMFLIYFSGVGSYLSYDQLKAHRVEVIQTVQDHFLAASLLYIGAYILSSALSIPGAAFLSLAGGFLFPQPLSTIYVVIGATCGATCLFIAARTALQEVLKKKAGSLLYKMESGFKSNAVSYMLFLRLVPIFPFWLVNIAPAFFGVRLRTFFWTTLVGIIPGAFVFTQAGTGLGAILDSTEPFSIGQIFNTQIKIALIALACFALIPIAIKKLAKHFSGKKPP